VKSRREEAVRAQLRRWWLASCGLLRGDIAVRNSVRQPWPKSVDGLLSPATAEVVLHAQQLPRAGPRVTPGRSARDRDCSWCASEGLESTARRSLNPTSWPYWADRSNAESLCGDQETRRT